MRRALAFVLAAALCGAPILVACGRDEGTGARVEDRPTAIADQEDAVCGMLVREQTAPRAQVVHRDGTRLFFCSIGDLLVHLDAPSPHGSVRAVFVEVMRPDEDPAVPHTDAHPWRSAEQAVYVVGVPRPGVMGAHVLVYEDAARAQAVADAHPGARVLDFLSLNHWWREAQRTR